jgi:hypothetical protein
MLAVERRIFTKEKFLEMVRIINLKIKGERKGVS